MDPGAAPSPSAVRLASELAAGATADDLVPDLEQWLTASPRFRAFASAQATKIRRKLRGAGDPESLRDVRLELQVARLLVSDRRVSLAWELYGSGKAGPDFTVTIPGQRPVNVEVTRLRRVPHAAEAPGPWLAKLRQLPTGMPNAILIGVDGSAAAVDIAASVRAVRARADAKDEAWFIARGFASTRTFYERFLRLGAVITWNEAGDAGDRAVLWQNASARIPLPGPAVRTIVTALRDGA